VLSGRLWKRRGNVRPSRHAGTCERRRREPRGGTSRQRQRREARRLLVACPRPTGRRGCRRCDGGAAHGAVGRDRRGEIGALVARIEALDKALDGRQPGSKGTATLLTLRIRASARLERWLAQYALTPSARAEWAARLAGGGLAAEIARRREGSTTP
jgi:hypothetical protein